MKRTRIRTRIKAPSRRKLSNRRRGTVILFAMICLLLVSMLGASLVKLALAQRRQIRREQWHVQAAWLADSAVDRAATQLAMGTGYSGETWFIEPTELGGGAGAQVRIVVEQDANRAGRFLVKVTADYPDDGEQRARVSRQVAVVPESPSR